MFYNRLLRFLVILLFLLSGQIYGQGLVRYNYHDEAHKKIKEMYHVKSAGSVELHGKYVSYFLNGKKESEGQFENNEAVGEWMFYYQTGNVRIKMEVTGKDSGHWEYFYENGNKSMEGHIEDNQRQGNWKFYYESGPLKNQGDFLNNKMERLWLTYFEDGKLKGTVEYKENKGLYKEFYPDGALRGEGQKNGFLNTGRWKYYFKTSFGGKLMLQAEGSNAEGSKVGEWKFFYSSGKLFSIGSYDSGVPDSSWVYYYPDGQVKRKGQYKKGNKEGEWETYFIDGSLSGYMNYHDGDGEYVELHTNGEIKVKGLVLNNKNEGMWQYFYEDGKLEGECEFSAGTGTYYGYYPNGKLKMTGIIQDDRRIGTWELYDEKGKLTGYYRPFYDAKVNLPEYADVLPPEGKETEVNEGEETIGKSSKLKYFNRKPDEFSGIIAGTNPLFLFAGRLPLAFEYYLQERLGNELELELIRDPFFEKDEAIALRDLYQRGYNISLRQKWYNTSDNPGLWYFGHELQFSNILHAANIFDQATQEVGQVFAKEKSYKYHFLFGYKLLGNTKGKGFSIDAFAGAGFGYRSFYLNDANSGLFLNLPENKLVLSFRFGFNFGYVFPYASDKATNLWKR